MRRGKGAGSRARRTGRRAEGERGSGVARKKGGGRNREWGGEEEGKVGEIREIGEEGEKGRR